jgi:hypothetical protein
VPALSSILFLSSTERVVGSLHAAPCISVLHGKVEEFFSTFRKIIPMTHNTLHSNCSLTAYAQEKKIRTHSGRIYTRYNKELGERRLTFQRR